MQALTLSQTLSNITNTFNDWALDIEAMCF